MAIIKKIPKSKQAGSGMTSIIGKSDREKEMQEVADELIKFLDAEKVEDMKTPAGRAWQGFKQNMFGSNRKSLQQFNCGS